MKAPAFWTEGGTLAHLLAPLGLLYALGGRWRRQAATPWRTPAPVVCIGNLTVGGTGKTPTAIAIARRLVVAGRRPVIVSRGYRGHLEGPVRVDPSAHSAADVGDEPLLLAEAGADSVREGLEGQANLTAMQLRAAFGEGACGAVAFLRGPMPHSTWATTWATTSSSMCAVRATRGCTPCG